MTSQTATLDAMPLHLLVGDALSGGTVTDARVHGAVGRPAWDRGRLLTDLELRLGLSPQPVTSLVRAQRLSARIASLAQERFYTRSYGRDPVATAFILLEWRDDLVLEGWDGDPIENGGTRLDALVELERVTDPPLGDGIADRVRAVERDLARCPLLLYESMALVDDPGVWPARWRRIVSALARRGTHVEGLALPLSIAGGDLGRVQRALAGKTSDGAFARDGSVVVLRADTSTEAALALAALLRRWRDRVGAVVVRGGGAAVLDAALADQGLATLGSSAASSLRPALQLLPLAVELLYEPRDPYRVLDLLTLPVGPLDRTSRRILARAICDAPGVGGRAWLAAKERLRQRMMQAAGESDGDRARRTRDQLDDVATWLEGPLHDPVAGAPREAVAELADRVAAWARGQLARTPGDPVLLAAHRQARELSSALASDPRDRLDLVSARHLVADAAAMFPVATWEARSGRIDVVDHPGAVLARADAVVWWQFASSRAASPRRIPWRPAEQEALRAAGIELSDPNAALGAEAVGWRRPIALADSRLVLVIFELSAGEQLEPHPLWSEIRARVPEEDLERVTVRARDLLGGRTWLDPAPEVEGLPPLELPSSRSAWRLPQGLLAAPLALSVSAIEALVGCPFRFVLEELAALRPGRRAAIPPLFQLAGALGHRMVEELHARGTFAAAPEELGRRAGDLFDELVSREAAPLLLPGASVERQQVRRQLVDAVVALARALAERGLRIAGVEVPVEASWCGRTLAGRIDVLAERAEGEAVIDLKWGRRDYRDLMTGGRAVQLAVYAHLRRALGGPPGGEVPAAYFSLSRAELLAGADLAAAGQPVLAGPSAAETWQTVERTCVAILAALEDGVVPVTGVAGAPELGEALSTPEVLSPPPGSACKYCQCDPLCGRRWEASS